MAARLVVAPVLPLAIQWVDRQVPLSEQALGVAVVLPWAVSFPNDIGLKLSRVDATSRLASDP